MELNWVWKSAATLFACYIFVCKFLRGLNWWYYDLKFRNKQYPLPPGDMGWPLFGNMLTFLKDFSSGHPDSLINNLVSKYGGDGIYKSHLFEKPCIIVTTSEMCKRVLTDDENFRPGYPTALKELLPSRPLNDVSGVEHRRFRRLVTAPIMGHSTLEMYVERIENIVVNALEEISSMKDPVELLPELKKISFQVIVNVFLGSKNQDILEKIGNLFSIMFDAVLSVPVNAPGFAFHKALKARKKLAKVVRCVVDERRMMIKSGQMENKDLIDILLQVKGDKGQKLEDEDIIDLLLGFLFAAHETTGQGMMWSTIYLSQHPDIMKKAKEEQEEIIKRRPPMQKNISIKEVKEMHYLSKVIDEMLRLANISFTLFREATADVNINGYMIPKGWRVLVWIRALHMDPKYYPNAEEFNPSRWDDFGSKAGTFYPFGGGSRMCPGMDLAKLEISIFLHYFLLNYKWERTNLECPVTCFPVPMPTDNCLGKVIRVT
ncbi:beta-amyrin 11-oxidase-like [Abrus precatorius]|uniref:Beta-amyrin 11-oxidase-like n=1 Tax=Abrus precatorius TaxID=3816 RepID=A0A8B8JZE9_ABRPR|nr:beta-amyrin 11-oxidase-like [Abrus precatorius]